MKVDLIFVNENTPESNVSVYRAKTKKDAIKKYNSLNETTTIKYAYLRKFSHWHHHIILWLKEKEAE